MSETINDRIEMLVNERFDGNKAAFAKSIGLPPTGMSSYLGKQRRSKPSVDMVTKIITTLNVDALWLLTGHETPKVEHFEQHGDKSVMAKRIDKIEMDNRSILDVERQTDVHDELKEEIVIPSDCTDEAKHIVTMLERDVSHLKSLLAEKDARINEKNEVITELRERIKELKSK